MSAKKLKQAKGLIQGIPQLMGKEIWNSDSLDQKNARGRTFALLRLLSIAFDGLRNNRIPSQAAALSYYTLIALGPLIAIIIMASSFIIQTGGDGEQDLAVDALTKLVEFIAPQTGIAVDTEGGVAAEPQVNEELLQFIRDIVDNARSGAVGIIGALVLAFISVQLLSTIEKTYNTIWGVRQGRPFMQRIVFYWTFISLGAIVGFASLSLGIYDKATSAFEQVPYSSNFQIITDIGVSVINFAVVTFLLGLFNRAIPNTSVRWGPALVGALVVTALLFANKNLTFLYVDQVVRQKSLFGSVGILPVLLFGLYIFWLFLLLGGQITYAAQNVNTLTNQKAWEHVSLRSRETLCLAAFILIARRFHNCEEPYNIGQLTECLRAPSHIINTSLDRLNNMGLICPIESHSDTSENITAYQPALPLEKMTLSVFKEKFETLGNNASRTLFRDLDPLLDAYEKEVLNYDSADAEPASIQSLFESMPSKNLG